MVKHLEVFYEVAFIALAAGDRIRALDLLVRKVIGKFVVPTVRQFERADAEIREGLEMWRKN